MKHFGVGLRSYLGLTLQESSFSPFLSIYQENVNTLFWFDLKQFFYHSWNLLCHCLPRSTHQLPGTLFLEELGISKGLRETTLSWLWGELLWGLGFLIPVRVVRCCGTHSALRTWTRCGEMWDLLLGQNKSTIEGISCTHRIHLAWRMMHSHC